MSASLTIISPRPILPPINRDQWFDLVVPLGRSPPVSKVLPAGVFVVLVDCVDFDLLALKFHID